MSDEIFEHETTETMTREQAAARLRELGAGGNGGEFLLTAFMTAITILHE